jgi:diacylglycerol kinase family enzyme
MVIILNVSAGTAAEGAAQIREKICDAFASAGVQPKVVSPDERQNIAKLARDAIAHGHDPIVAAGGDGTISAVAAEIAGTGKTLGVLPLGTLNHFAKDLRIPLELNAAVQTIAHGHVVAVDVAEVNGKVFVNNSSLGIYPRIVSHREAQRDRLARGKWPAFLWATFRAFHRFPFIDLRITIEGEQLARRTAFLFAGNNHYEIAGFRLGSRATLSDGRLGLYLTHRTGRFGLLRLAVRALFGRLNQAADFEAFSVAEARIESRRQRLLVATDGEVQLMQTPLHYRSRPGALRVFVPAAKERA